MYQRPLQYFYFVEAQQTCNCMESSSVIWYLKKIISLRQNMCLEHTALLWSLAVIWHSRLSDDPLWFFWVCVRIFSFGYMCYLNQQICVHIAVSGKLLPERRVIGFWILFWVSFFLSKIYLIFTSYITQGFGFDQLCFPPACSLLVVTEIKYVSWFSGDRILFFRFSSWMQSIVLVGYRFTFHVCKLYHGGSR